MLLPRISTALILLAIAAGILFYTPAHIFSAAAWLLCLLAIYELTKMYRFTQWQSIATAIIATAIAIAIAVSAHDCSQVIRIIAVVTWCFMVPLILIFTPRKFPKLAIMIFALMLFIPAYYSLTVINALFGPWQLVSLMAVAWVADTGAYFVGKSLGKHKLAPRISPGKSIEGAIGGFALVVIYLLILKYFNAAIYLPKYGTVFKFAFILTAISIVGDLFESWLKRVAQVKDSGTLLPGHGGVFDRIDSLIAVMAIAFAIIRGMI